MPPVLRIGLFSFNFAYPVISVLRNIAKPELLMEDPSEDWTEADCPETKRLKVSARGVIL